MSEPTATVEVPKTTEETPVAATEPVAETKPAETTEAAPAEAAAEAVTEAPAEAAAAPAEEAKKEEVVPIEEGTLEHKGANFPKNLIYSKHFAFFGTEAVDVESLKSYVKNEKIQEVLHHNLAWAAETGKGLLFLGDKTAPTGVINLADASEPTAEGTSKFSFVVKGHKHAFKAPTLAARDNWVAQLKTKIEEAKTLAATVTETETYKKTLESFKPPKKEEKPAEPAAEAAEPAAEAAETPKAAEEAPKEETKRRSASRKRASIFGILGSKKEEKKEEKAVEAAPATEAAAEVPAEAAATEPAVEAAPATEETAPAAAETTEDKPAEAEAPKPTPAKRNSIFGNVFSKKEKKAAEPAPAAPAKDSETAAPASTEVAPVIPPVETATPLAAEEVVAASDAVETPAEVPATNGAETKKEVKSEKRKASLPFNFGKKEKSPTSDEEGDKPVKKELPLFQKVRATLKARGKPSGEKKEEKKEEAAAEDKPAEEAAASTEPAAPVAEAAPAVEEPEIKPENVATTTPAVTAAA